MIGMVNVPGVSTTDLANKVDKISGKGLSTNDFTDAYKSKLDTVDTTVTANSGNLVTSGAVSAALPGFASSQTAGIVKIGSGLSITDGVVSVDSSASGPTITYGTEDLTDGVSSLATGSIYFVYE